jgi:hypothetical protein
LALECQALLADDATAYEAPLAELSRSLVRQLAPQELRPQSSRNALLELERAFAEGFAELERAGYRTEGISTFDYMSRLAHLERRASKKTQQV